MLVRNPNWWGAKLYPGNIDRIEWTVIPDREARVRALLDGEIDFLRDVPDEALERIRATPGLKLAPYADLWVDGLFLNQARGAPPGTDVEWSKPFRDRRVREAVYHAIDAQALTEGALQGLGVPTGSLVVPSMPSYSPELDQRLPYDPEKARALLAEAGYGAGFDMELDCRDFAESACRDVERQLAKVGIRVAVNMLPGDVYDSKEKDRTLRSTLFSRATIDTFGDVDMLRLFYSKEGGGIEGYSYANPKFDALFEQIDRARPDLRARRSDRRGLAHDPAGRHRGRAAVPRGVGLGDARQPRSADQPRGLRLLPRGAAEAGRGQLNAGIDPATGGIR